MKDNDTGGFWKSFGGILGVVGFLVACFAFDGLLAILADVPIIGFFAKLLIHLRETAH